MDLVPLQLLLRHRKLSKRDSDLLLLASQREFGALWKGAAHLLALQKSIGVPHVYVLRHRGPSADRLYQRRSRAAQKARGRWASDRSLKRYEKRGRVLEQPQRVSMLTRTFATTCEATVWDVLAGRRETFSVPLH